MKHFFAPVFDPLGAIWLLMCFGMMWLIWRRQWRSAAWLGMPVMLMFLIGSTPLVRAIVARAERRYAGDTALGIRERSPGSDDQSASISNQSVVVVLGGGYYLSDQDAFGFALTEAGSRVVAGVELARKLKPRCLVLGGSVPFRDRPGIVASELVQKWVESWNLAATTVTNLGICRDTHDEAIRFRQMREHNGWQRVVLVTSALHMRRAVALFKKQGIEVVPAACDFQEYGVPHVGGWSPFPRQKRFNKLGLYLHEVGGWIVAWWKGWT